MAGDAPRSVTSGFSPKRSPRPQYPAAASVLKKFLLHSTRSTFITAVLTLAIAPAFFSLVGSLESSGYSERVIFTFLISLAHSLTYVVINLLFFELGCDLLGWFRRYKLERRPIQIPASALFKKTLAEAATGQMFVSPALAYAVFPFLQQLGMPPCNSALPGVYSLWWQFCVANWFNDFFFYWSHRAVHTTAIYPHIHKKHHTYTGSIGVAAEYAHPIEGLLSNLLPTMGGVFLLGRHPLVSMMWLVQRLQQTYEAHSGYSFYGSWLHKIGLTNAEGAAWHDYHHSGNQGNFGAEYLDWIFGTMDHYCELGGVEGYIAHCKKNASKAAA